MSFGQVLAVGAVALKKIGHGVEPEAVNTHFTPMIHYAENFFLYQRIVIIQIGLVREKTMPVILLGHRVPGPVGCLKILENNACIFVLLRIISPDIVFALRRTLWRFACPLKPWVLIGCVINDQFSDHL